MMRSAEAQVRQWLESGTAVAATWEAGGDETLVYIWVAGEALGWSDPRCEPICDVIAETLELPNAGEWFVTGGGTLRLDGRNVVIDHDSMGSGMGWDPETDEEFYLDEQPIAGTDILWHG